MITFDYLVWFHRQASKRHMSATTRGLYEYLIMEAVAVGLDSVPNTTLRGLAKELGVSHATISQSLKTLGDAKLIKRLANGDYWIIAPDVSWLTKRQPMSNHENLAYNSCACEVGGCELTNHPQRGLVNSTNPTVATDTTTTSSARTRKIEFVVHEGLPNMPSRSQQDRLEQTLNYRAEPVSKAKLDYIAKQLRMGKLPERFQ